MLFAQIELITAKNDFQVGNGRMWIAQKGKTHIDNPVCGGKMFFIYKKGRWENDAGNCNTWAFYSGTDKLRRA